MKMADGIAAIEDPAQRAAVANRLFGRSGKELLNVLAQGSAGLKEFIRQAEEIGGPLSREDIAQVEAANDAIDKMGRLFEGIFQSIAINISPAITDMALGIQALKPLVDEFADAWKGVQNELEDVLTLLIGGQAAFEIELGGSVKKKETASSKAGDLPPALLEVKKGFAEAATFQSSKAFDILNPDKPSSIAGQNKAANEMTAKNTAGMKSRLDKLVGTRATITVIPGG